MFSTEDPLFVKSLIEHALSDTRGRKRWHITRLSMYLALENLLKAHDGSEKRCLCVSRSEALADVLGVKAAARTITRYPDVNMLSLPYPDEHFDVVLSDQVLEHIEGDPFRAVRESVRVAKPGGWIVHTTCFINFMHQLPLDFWRFTPRSLEIMLLDAGAATATSGGWGSRLAWTYMQLGFRMEKIPEVAGNPVYELARLNEKKWPVTTWGIAQKAPGPA